MGKARRAFGIGFIILVVVLTSCESVFTTNLFEWAQRDPSNMSESQKIAYGKDALASNDEKAMEKAYDALKDTKDSSLKPFVAELALGAAGVTNAMADMLGDVAAGGTEAEIKAAMEEKIASFSSNDLVLITEAATLIQAAETAGAAVTADQYFVAGVGLLVVALDAAGGDAYAIDTSSGPGSTAIAFLTAAKNLMPEGSDAADLLGDFSDYF